MKLFPFLYKNFMMKFLNFNDLTFYLRMQKITYQVLSSRDARVFCVGSFDEHEKYPYEKYLLKNFNGKKIRALDFGCGIGRMVKRFKQLFFYVDGIDISKNNIKIAQKYCNNDKNKNTSLFYVSDGIKFNQIQDQIYNFVYSTIAMQHIALYSVRLSIFQEIYRVLLPGGHFSIQMTYIDDIKNHPKYNKNVHLVKPKTGVAAWRDNPVWAMTTNSGYDIVLDKNSIKDIENDLRKIGFTKFKYEMAPPAHKGTEEYIFIYANKPNI